MKKHDKKFNLLEKYPLEKEGNYVKIGKPIFGQARFIVKEDYTMRFTTNGNVIVDANFKKNNNLLVTGTPERGTMYHNKKINGIAETDCSSVSQEKLERGKNRNG